MANLLLECILCLLLMLYETLSLNRSLWQNGQISVLTVEEVTEVFFFFFQDNILSDFIVHSLE